MRSASLWRCKFARLQGPVHRGGQPHRGVRRPVSPGEESRLSGLRRADPRETGQLPADRAFHLGPCEIRTLQPAAERSVCSSVARDKYASSILASRTSACDKSTRSRLARRRFTAYRVARVKFAVESVAPSRLAKERSALRKSAPDRFAHSPSIETRLDFAARRRSS